MESRKKLKQTGTSYPLQLELRYKALNSKPPTSGIGKTLEISSTKIVFTADAPIEMGAKVVLSIAWPALLNNRVALQLVIEGQLTGGDGPTLTATITKHHFRTRAVIPYVAKAASVMVPWPGSHATCAEASLAVRAHA